MSGPWAIIGKTVQNRRGPAAVTGDEHRNDATIQYGWEGAIIRIIRKSEDLLMTIYMVRPSWNRVL